MKLLKLFLTVVLLFLSITVYKTPIAMEEQSEKNVYLTFDDGPTCKNTPLLLDKLKELELPATFFVVGKLINENPDIMERIIKENHSVGLHTMSHNKGKCYASHESFIKENQELQELLQSKFNTKTNLIRFPFGSQNPYLRMNKTFLEKLHKENFKIFDWHIDTIDAIRPQNDANTILQICKNQYQKYYNNNKNLIILMHTNSNNNKTIESLSLIKEHFTNLGYKFKSLNDDVKEVYNVK